jgi:hypothetical protein
MRRRYRCVTAIQQTLPNSPAWVRDQVFIGCEELVSRKKRCSNMRFPLRTLGSPVITICVAGILVSCSAGIGTSGIKGHVIVDAGCPEIIESTPCAQIPLPARITIRDDSGTTVREATSNDEGEFQLELPSGTYELHAANLSGAPMPSAPPQEVVIKAGSFTEVKVAFDSGVR